ncbi:MAG: iron-containing alcohol dehydrogenase [Clostridiales bacterium]|nr:iron-containing alcohol dehydrogenase [Clostridiales bacterium]
MNIFNKIYCRTFQSVFKLALPLLPYKQPEILDSVDKVPSILKESNIDKVFIVTDGGVIKCGLVDGLTAALSSANIDCSIYDKTMPNPTVAAVEEALGQYVDENCKAIIAVGGGSPMDLAKAVGARVARPKKNLKDMAGIMHVRKKLPLLIAVPTTAGTGSETTLAAVITDEKTHRKFAINDFPLIPRYAVLDYKLTLGLPKPITAYTGMDALTHAVEAFIGRSTTKDTREKAIQAVKLVHENLKTAYDNPLDENARRNMLYAAHYAGIAFTKSYVGYVHAVAHSLSGKYGLAHGLTCSVLLPVVLESYGKAAHKKLAVLAREIGVANESDSKSAAAEKFISWVYSMNDYLGIPRGFTEIKDEDIDGMSAFAAKEGNPLYPVPKLFSRKQLKQLYYKVKL